MFLDGKMGGLILMILWYSSITSFWTWRTMDENPRKMRVWIITMNMGKRKETMKENMKVRVSKPMKKRGKRRRKRKKKVKVKTKTISSMAAMSLTSTSLEWRRRSGSA
jgi:hypothetical protein